MKLQALSIEQMQELIDMGIDTSNASCIWWNFADVGFALMLLNDGRDPITIEKMKYNHGAENVIPAFTLQDIIELIPAIYEYSLLIGANTAMLFDDDTNEAYHFEYGTSSLDAAFKMLKWSKKNKHI